ncbi:type II toxin-antitoxin system HicA family toxin [Brevundimonas sp.]|uniref:type II toxin-antitoxin system HicA family toxin n=1 Tax=Brevundimonas sp. TaxID=1871086 RepID=UPI00272F8678|nr:type II toxin-antitoxin system HicA family toxin [Brevundimonas sp.]MDP1913636.1 type II toxin-antitoxin system HicA family toxin [Brevundimonas sp.]
MVSSREILKALQADGWRVIRQSGSHAQLKHSNRLGTVTVPHPRRDMPIGTLRSIERQSGMTFGRK